MKSPFPLILYMSLALFLALFFGGCGEDDNLDRGESSKESQSNSFEVTTFSATNSSLAQAIERYVPVSEFGKRDLGAAALTKAASVALKQVDFDAAAKLASRATELEPDNAEAYLVLGKALYNSISGEQNEARKAFEKAVALDPKMGRAYENLSRICFDQNDTKGALVYMDKAIAFDPGQRDYYKYRSSLYASLKEFDKAEADMIRYVDASPKKKLAGLLDLSAFYESRGKNKEAIAGYDKIIAQTKAASPGEDAYAKRGRAFRSKALLLYKLGRYKETIEALDQLMAFEKNSEEIFRLRGDSCFRLKMYKQAIADYSRAIELMPDSSARPYLARAEVYEQIGQADKASSDRKIAKQLSDAPAEKHLYEMKK
ncbi:MAG: tetratricopeptide repeat protein [Candidatus Obscuribacterales bacterium]|nr:tetratricopeptide repeat protein [Candidatus Obscuribacterales bacterium]